LKVHDPVPLEKISQLVILTG